MSTIVEDHFPRFSSNVARVLDEGLGEMASDILITARVVTPFDKGQLRADSDVHKMGALNWRVRYHKEYALVQEQGHAGGRQFRNYTTAGTGAGYLKKSGDKINKKAISLLKKHAGRARA